MIRPEDVFLEIERHQLSRLCVSSTYQCTERWTKESLQFKVLVDFLVGGDISYNDVFDRLKMLAEKEFDEQYACPNDIPIYVYLLALSAMNEPYSEEAEERYHEGCKLVSKVNNLHWARRHVSAWTSHEIFKRNQSID
jgi:hypothetical protein